MASKRLRKIQIGKETTPGTNVAATAILRGEGTMKDLTEVKFSTEDVGVLSGTDRSFITKTGGEIDFEGEANFEQLPFFLAMSIKDTVTPASDGVGTGKIYTYDFPTTSANSIKTYSVEAGDDQQAEEFSYGFVPEFSLEGAAGEVVKMKAKLVGQTVSNTTFTGALSLTDVNTLVFSKAKIYLDAIGGTFGTTLVSGALLGFSGQFKGGKIARWSANGDTKFSHLASVEPEAILDLTWEHVAAAVTEKTNWRNQTPRKLQLKIEGPALTTGGTTYQNYTVIINLAGKWVSFDKIDEQDGNDILTGKFQAKYNATAATFGQIIVVNQIASI